MLFNPLNLWISLSKSLFISARDLSCLDGAITLYFIYHVKVMSLKLVSNYAIVTCFTDHIASHMNRCFSSSSLPIPWNAKIPRGRIIPCLIVHTWNGTWSSSPIATCYNLSCEVSLTSVSTTLVPSIFVASELSSSVAPSSFKMHEGGGSKSRLTLGTSSSSLVNDHHTYIVQYGCVG